MKAMGVPNGEMRKGKSNYLNIMEIFEDVLFFDPRQAALPVDIFYRL
jgi:hypothetical protein